MGVFRFQVSSDAGPEDIVERFALVAPDEQAMSCPSPVAEVTIDRTAVDPSKQVASTSGPASSSGCASTGTPAVALLLALGRWTRRRRGR